MKTTYYQKIGRRYIPVSEYDTNFSYALPKGNHLISCFPGGASTRYNVDPAYAPMIAAGRVAKEAITEAISEASKMQRDEHEGVILTEEQHAAWEYFVKVMGERGRYVKFKSINDIAEAGVNAMIQEADKMLEHPSVRKAYDQFMLMCKLVSVQEKAE